MIVFQTTERYYNVVKQQMPSVFFHNDIVVMCAVDFGHTHNGLETSLHIRKKWNMPNPKDSLAFAACQDSKLAYEKAFGFPKYNSFGDWRSFECFPTTNYQCPTF